MESIERPLAAHPTDARVAHLRDYWRILWQGRYTVLAIFAAAVGLTFLQVSLSVPVYEATATIEIKPEPRRILPGQEQWVGAEGGGWLAEEKYFNTQLQVLQSRDLAERVVRQLRLADDPEFKNTSSPVAAFAGRISVRPRPNTRLVSVSVRSPDPKRATEWANAVVEAYRKRNVDEATASFSAIMDEIQKELGKFRTNLGEADLQRLKTAADKDLYIPENQQDILKQNLATYHGSLSDLRVESASLKAELDNLDRIRREGGDLLMLPSMAKDEVIQDLNTQKLTLERDLERLAAEKKPRHPEVLAKQAELKDVKVKLEAQADGIAEKLRTQFAVAQSNESYLLGQIRKTEQQAYLLKQASSPYEMQKTDAESKRKVYDVVAERVEGLSVGAQLISMNNNVSILDKAVEPRAPVRPRKVLSLGFGALLGLLLGVGAVFFLDYLDNTVRSPEDVEQFLGLQILGIIPKFKDPGESAAREAFQSLRTSILFSSHNRERNVLLFTSAGPQEGKSSTVAAIARSLAASGDRVIILDCDLRRPTQHQRLGLAREPGITNYLLDGTDGDVTRFMQTTELPALKLLACGTIPPNPVELIGSTKFKTLLERLKRNYDWVILDSPPVASLADSVVLASMVDMMAFVIKHNENDRELIRRSVKRLREVRANIAGAVLNNVALDGSGGYYYAGYYHYAAEEQERRGARRLRRDDKGSRVAL